MTKSDITDEQVERAVKVGLRILCLFLAIWGKRGHDTRDDTVLTSAKAYEGYLSNKKPKDTGEADGTSEEVHG